MTFVRCLHCEATFQHTQEARHSAEKHPDGHGDADKIPNSAASAYREEER